MRRKVINNLALWQFENLETESSIKHFVTDRKSNGEQKEFTLSYSSLADRVQIGKNRDMLAKALDIEVPQLYFPSQVHKARIVKVNRSTSKEELMETDALITNEKGICVAIMVADCVPILLFDKKNMAVGAVHSGWKGTVLKILERTLLEMHSQFGTNGEDLLVGIGPSVCQESYEVGEEVIQAVKKTFGEESKLMLDQPHNKAKLDLWNANKIQLLQFGVDESRIEISNVCTVTHNNYFFSARKGDAGRFAAGIMLK